MTIRFYAKYNLYKYVLTEIFLDILLRNMRYSTWIASTKYVFGLL